MLTFRGEELEGGLLKQSYSSQYFKSLTNDKLMTRGLSFETKPLTFRDVKSIPKLRGIKVVFIHALLFQSN